MNDKKIQPPSPAGPLKLSTALISLSVVVFVLGLFTSPERAWRNLLFHNFYFLSVSVMACVFLAIQHITKAGWPTLIRRVPEAMAGYLPVGAALMLLCLVGVDSIYEWASPEVLEHDAVLRAKSAYLNRPAFALRAIGCVVLWCGLGYLLIRYSRIQDADGRARWTRRSFRLSIAFAIVIVLTYSVATVDWLMSLEPHWYSTLFPWYVTSSAFAGSLALITFCTVQLRRRGLLPGVSEHHLHDLGKYLFAFSAFWGYLWFSQYMLIWYANIPEETSYFHTRSGGWGFVHFANVTINLVLPFLLLSAGAKRNEKLLLSISAIVFFGHWLDFYLMAMPSLMRDGPRFGLLEAGIGLGVASAFSLCFERTLAGAAIQPQKDPYLVESLHHHV